MLILESSVRKYVFDGHLLFDPYHDGALLRFEWNERAVREIIRGLTMKKYITSSEIEKTRNEMLKFCEGWAEWDANK